MIDAEREPEHEADHEGDRALHGDLWESERIVSDAIGRLMVLWGFKRNMGRVWTLLFLSDEPLGAEVLRERLQLSAGAVSMTLSELSRWGVVCKVWRQGDRHDYYQAERSLWKMISRVLRERERAEVVQAVEAFEDALSVLARRGHRDHPRTRVQRERIEQLLDLARMGRTMLDALIDHARLDVSGWLPRFRFGRAK